VVSERRVCGLLSIAVSSYRYQVRDGNADLRTKVVELAREMPRHGYRRLHVLLQREGEVANHKRVYRVYREAGLCLRRKKRKHCTRLKSPLRQHTAANQEWALDFVHDALAAGRSIRVLSVVDAYNRVVFNIKGNVLWLVVAVDYLPQVVFINWLGCVPLDCPNSRQACRSELGTSPVSD
jgi:transposase InsO family protein